MQCNCLLYHFYLGYPCRLVINLFSSLIRLIVVDLQQLGRSILPTIQEVEEPLNPKDATLPLDWQWGHFGEELQCFKMGFNQSVGLFIDRSMQILEDESKISYWASGHRVQVDGQLPSSYSTVQELSEAMRTFSQMEFAFCCGVPKHGYSSQQLRQLPEKKQPRFDQHTKHGRSSKCPHVLLVDPSKPNQNCSHCKIFNVFLKSMKKSAKRKAAAPIKKKVKTANQMKLLKRKLKRRNTLIAVRIFIVIFIFYILKRLIIN